MESEDEITTMTLAELGAAIAALEGVTDEIERARQAHELFEVARRVLPKVRATALFAASRGYGGRVRVAKALGVTPDAISKSMKELTKE